VERRTNELSKRMREVYEEVSRDLYLDQIQLHDKAMKAPAIKAKYVTILFEEQKYLERLEDTKETVLAEYIAKHGSPGVPKFKIEGEASKLEKVHELDKAIADQKDVVRFVDTLLNKAVTNFGYDIKNCVTIVVEENR